MAKTTAFSRCILTVHNCFEFAAGSAAKAETISLNSRLVSSVFVPKIH